MWTNEYTPDNFGFQVLLSVYNGEKYIERCLKSLNSSLAEHNWILLYGDDGCTDDTTIELARYARNLTCDKVHLYEYDKAPTVGFAKNRLIKEAHNFKEDYPYILFMDVDDMMLPERPRMVKTAIENNSDYVVGAWEKIRSFNNKNLVKSSSACEKLRFGPWATLFNCSFLPEDGIFFPQDKISNSGHEDLLTWNHLKYIKGIEPTPHPSKEPVHSYIQTLGSVSNIGDTKKLNYRRNIFWGIASLIKNNQRNIFENPLSREEAEEAMNEYIKLKKIEKAEADSIAPLLD